MYEHEWTAAGVDPPRDYSGYRLEAGSTDREADARRREGYINEFAQSSARNQSKAAERTSRPREVDHRSWLRAVGSQPVLISAADMGNNIEQDEPGTAGQELAAPGSLSLTALTDCPIMTLYEFESGGDKR